MASAVLVELKASSTEFMAKMGEARAEIAKLDTESSGHFQKVQAVGKAAFLGIAGAAVVVGAESVRLASSFQSAMELIHTQAGASQEEVNKLSGAVLSLAGKTATAPDELAAGLYHLESSGLRGAKAMQALQIAAEGAKVGQANLEDVTNALNAVIASGIHGAQNMTGAMGALNAIVGAGDMRMQDLADAMGTGVLASVKGFGLSLNDVGAALATFGDNNIRGADAATQLRMAVLFMAHPAKTAGAVLKELGMTTSTLADDMRTKGLGGALADLHERLVKTGNTGARMGQILVEAFGHKAGTGLAVLEQQFTRFQSKQEEVARGSKTFGDSWAATQKTFHFQMQQLVATVEALATRFGILLIPVIERVAAVTANVVQWFTRHRTTAEALAAVIGGVLTFAMATWAVTAVTASATTEGALLNSMGAATAWAASLIADAVTASAAWVMAMAPMLASAIVTAAGIIIAFAPLILGLAAIGVAAYLLYSNWTTVWNGIKAAFDAVWSAIKTVFGAVVNFIKEHAAVIVGAIMLIAPPIGIIIVAVHELYTHWSTVWNAIKTVTSAVAGVLKTIFGAIAGAGLDVIKAGVSALQTVWNAAWGAIKTVASGAWSVLSPVFHEIVNVGIALVKREIQGLQTVWSDVWNGILTVVNAIWSVLEPIFNTIKTAIHDITGGLGKVASVAGKIGGAVGWVGHKAGFAAGTDYAPGGMALVGEEGPELVNLPRGSQVIPNNRLGGGGDTIIHVNVTGSVLTPVDLADAVHTALLRKQRRTGALGLT